MEQKVKSRGKRFLPSFIGIWLDAHSGKMFPF
jgi:ribosomal protein S19